MKRFVLPITFISVLSSCGQPNPHRHHKRQVTPSDIKISTLNLQQKLIQIRFEYRSYISRNFEQIECQTKLADTDMFTISLYPEVTFDSFSTEILTFKDINFNSTNDLIGSKEISYYLNCKIKYDKGNEYIIEESVLYLAPNSQFSYR
jgi:hypothetical protein